MPRAKSKPTAWATVAALDGRVTEHGHGLIASPTAAPAWPMVSPIPAKRSWLPSWKPTATETHHSSRRRSSI